MAESVMSRLQEYEVAPRATRFDRTKPRAMQYLHGHYAPRASELRSLGYSKVRDAFVLLELLSPPRSSTSDRRRSPLGPW